MNRKKILVTRSSMPELDEYVEEIRDLWESHWLTNMGKKHIALQKELESYLQVDKVELLTNGHMALELALQALELEGEVITTPFTFVSTTHAIVRNGLTPVFCDINPGNYTIDVSKIEDLITDRTCAIMPTHVYGNVCDVEKIDAIAQKYNLKVIYDAAHSFGVRYNGVGVGTFGDIACFSFHATKVFNTIEGGAICYSDSEVGKKIYYLKNFGIKDEETVVGVGANAKMNEFQAAMGLCNLRHINREIEKRRVVYERYCKNLYDLSGIVINSIPSNVQSNYSYFPILIEHKQFGMSRDELYEVLQSYGIFARKYFYPLTNEYECYAELAGRTKTPVAKNISNSVLTLPMYADLSETDIDYICDVIRKAKR